jgi:hypothetical protein
MRRVWRGPREKLTPEQTAANAARKAARLAAAMHCQICGRAILANTGHIALHGYTRPGQGWQTSSCHGAKKPPFEVSRDAIGTLIVSLQAWLAREIEDRGKAEAETIPIVLTYGERNRNTGRRDPRTIQVTRATFQAVKAEREGLFLTHSWHDFNKVKTTDLFNREQAIQRLADDIIEFQKRYDGWKQTHAWNIASQSWHPLGKE